MGNKEGMDKLNIKGNLILLNEELRKREIQGDIALYGEAVMALVYDAREMTLDIDAVFEPKQDISEIIDEMTEQYNLNEGWFNDRVKGFLSENNELSLYEELANLRIYTATAEYMFAMKILSSRLTHKSEVDDIRFFLDYLNIGTLEKAEEILYRYYPAKRILPKTFYMLMELLEE